MKGGRDVGEVGTCLVSCQTSVSQQAPQCRMAKKDLLAGVYTLKVNVLLMKFCGGLHTLSSITAHFS